MQVWICQHRLSLEVLLSVYFYRHSCQLRHLSTTTNLIIYWRKSQTPLSCGRACSHIISTATSTSLKSNAWWNQKGSSLCTTSFLCHPQTGVLINIKHFQHFQAFTSLSSWNCKLLSSVGVDNPRVNRATWWKLAQSRLSGRRHLGFTGKRQAEENNLQNAHLASESTAERTLMSTRNLATSNIEEIWCSRK